MSGFEESTVRDDKFTEKLRKCLCELLILTMLKEKPMYTYEITREINGICDGLFRIKTLHIIIYRLQEMGCIYEKSQQVANNRTRIYYDLTKEGDEYLTKIIKKYYEMTSITNQILEQTNNIR